MHHDSTTHPCKSPVLSSAGWDSRLREASGSCGAMRLLGVMHLTQHPQPADVVVCRQVQRSPVGWSVFSLQQGSISRGGEPSLQAKLASRTTIG